MCSSSETVGGFPPCVSQPVARSPSTLYSGRHSKLGGLSQRGRGRVGTGAAASLPRPHTRVSGGRNGGGGRAARAGRLAALPSGGRCAAASASPPAGAPCLSDPGEAPRWKDRDRVRPKAHRPPGRVPEEQGVRDTPVPEVLESPFLAGVLRDAWREALGEARKEPALLPAAPSPKTVHLWMWTGGCGSLWKAVHAPALTCAPPAGPEPRVRFRCERLTQSKTRTRLTDTSTEHLADLGTVSATGH